MKKLNLFKNSKLLIVLLSVLLVSLSGCGKVKIPLSQNILCAASMGMMSLGLLAL